MFMLSFANYLQRRLEEAVSAAGRHDSQAIRFNSLYQGDNYQKAKDAILQRYGSISTFLQKTEKEGELWSWLWKMVYGSRESANE